MDDKTIGAYIKRLGNEWKDAESGRRMIDLYEGLGMQKQHWYQVCRGDSLGKGTVKKLAQFFGVSEIDIRTAGQASAFTDDQYKKLASVMESIAKHEGQLSDPLTTNERTRLAIMLLKMDLTDPDLIHKELAVFLPAGN